MNKASIHKLHISNSEKIDRQWSERASSPCPHIAGTIGFAWLCSDGRGATGVTSVRNHQKLAPCAAEPIPGGSRMDNPLAKAGPIRNGGNASVITDLRRRKRRIIVQM